MLRTTSPGGHFQILSHERSVVCGSWTNNEQHKFYYEKHQKGADMAGIFNNYITVNRIYYHNKNAKDF